MSARNLIRMSRMFFWSAATVGMWMFLVSLSIASSASATGLNGDESYTAGPNVCAECHQHDFDEWLSHGHSRKLAHVPGGDLGGLFGLTSDADSAGFLLPGHDPDVYNWDNILFVIGASKHWKTRFVGLDGFILTKGGQNQYNWQDGTFSDYHKDEVKVFDCGSCHTTGYRADGTAFAAFPGIVGDFAQFNITCEACHGPGAAHAAAPSKNNIKIDTSAELCGRCHRRGDDDDVLLASGGFIRHHEQFQEFLKSPHKNFDCTSCHEPHVTRRAGIKVPEGQTEVCALCHSDKVTEYAGSAMQLAGVMCQDCHMGRATKSAIKKGPYEGDVWTHLFRINTAADYTMFTDDGGQAKDALSLEYACFRCHADASKAAFSAITNYHTIGK